MSRCLSNLSSLCVLANEPPLYIWRRKLSIQYCLKLSSSLQNTHCKFKDLFERKSNQIPPLCIRVQPDLQSVGFIKKNALIYSIPATPPSLFKRPHINYNIIVPSKITPHLKSTEISSLSFVTITKISLDCTLMALRWGTKWHSSSSWKCY